MRIITSKNNWAIASLQLTIYEVLFVSQTNELLKLSGLRQKGGRHMFTYYRENNA